MSQVYYVKVFRTNQYENLLLLDNRSRVRSQIKSVAYRVQRFNFDCNLVLTRKLIIPTPSALGLKPKYELVPCRYLRIRTVALIESASRFPHCMAAARRARAGFRKFEIFANFRKFGTGTREYQ